MFINSVELFEYLAPKFRHLPGAVELCDGIRPALDRPIDTEWTLPYWSDIGESLLIGVGFPGNAFRVILAAEKTFDVRWPLSLACWYWESYETSIDQECACFLQDVNLVDEARKCLSQYAARTEWLSRFRPLIE
jgi:hypothetical protein